MPRFLLLLSILAAPAGLLGFVACSSTASDTGSKDRDSGMRRDAALVEPPDARGSSDAAPPPPPPSCDTYCARVLEGCTGDDAQYATREECMGFCERFPTGKAGEDDTATLGCREQFSGSPTKTDPSKYCAAAGPFGGGVCGDRCAAFCQVTLSACAPDAGLDGGAPFASYASCLTACAGYRYEDAGTALDGPEAGDTLNCRLFHLRAAVESPAGCRELGPDGADCR